MHFYRPMTKIFEKLYRNIRCVERDTLITSTISMVPMDVSDLDASINDVLSFTGCVRFSHFRFGGFCPLPGGVGDYAGVGW